MFFNEEEIKTEQESSQEVEQVSNTPLENEKETLKQKENKKPENSFQPISDEFLPNNFNPFARPINPRFANRPQREQEFEERVLQIKRVIKVTKGGRRFKFSALVVVGDKKGRVGYGIGKHIEVPEAIKKAVRQARKNLINIKITGSADTVPHEVIGHKGAARVMLKPAAEGKGVIASDVVRAVVELAGIRNIYSKNLGTNNPLNVVIATVEGLTQMKTGSEFKYLKSDEVKKPLNTKDTKPVTNEIKKPLIVNDKKINNEMVKGD